MLLITGGTGNVGRTVVRQLRETSAPLRVLVRGEDDRRPLAGVDIVTGDLTYPQSLEPAFDGVERAFLLPANAPTQLQMERNFIEAARRSGVRHVVKLSVIGADPEADSAILAAHGASERLLAESGLPHTILRPNYFMQNLLALAGAMRAQGVLAMPFNDATVGMIDVRDIAAVAVKALTETGHEGRTYALTGPESVSFAKVARRISPVIGREVSYQNIGVDDLRRALLGFDMTEWYAEALSKLMGRVGAGDYALVTNTVVEVTGRPARTFAQFLDDHADALRG